MFGACSLLRATSRNDALYTNCNSFLDTQTDSESSPEEEMTKCIRSVRTRFAVATANNNYPTEFAGVPGLSSSMPSSQLTQERAILLLMLPVRRNLGILCLTSELAVSLQGNDTILCKPTPVSLQGCDRTCCKLTRAPLQHSYPPL